jgi:outer membrane protein
MRRLAPLFVLAMLAFALPAASQAGPKIGYINSQQILEQAPGAAEASQQFESDLEQLRSRIQPATDSLEQMIQEYEAQALTLSPEAKQRREQAILAKREQVQRLAEQLDQQAGQRRAELVQPIMDKITQVIEEMRVEGNYAVIFDVAAGSIIAADPSLDLTQEVLRRLQAQGIGGGE